MKIPYPMVPAVHVLRRHAYMACAVYREPRLARMKRVPIADNRSLTIACYGPSLQDTYKDMKHPIMSMSGATHWLYERGIVPDYHVDMDPHP